MKKLSALFVALCLTACSVGNERQEGTIHEKEASVQFLVDAMEATEEVRFDLTMKNKTDQEITFEFPSSQLYEIIVTNEEGDDVYRYSNGKMFTQAIHYETINPSDYRTWTESWNYMKDGQRVPPGKYTVKAIWKGNAKDVPKQFVTKEKFTVPSAHPSIKDVVVKENDELFIVTGKVKTSGNVIKYVVEDGHDELAKGEVDITKENEWTSFAMKLNKKDLSSERAIILLLYSKESDEPYIFPLKVD
ncbi:BsuPI-related putative proteinase inhibitor [Bacillus sp. FJAT-47783]|uniref:BsuPI-related putative proteinase inhibitor n=1 Tax=Bacillus sp. FJAT-47783 TaxID=2922712 RepID=UPI001FADCA13|nr:BsuPI-related putative proteinase inhibitor [Bacillus sp. FJAT-47783]